MSAWNLCGRDLQRTESEKVEKTDCGRCLCKDGGLGLKKHKVYVQSGMYLRGQKWPLLCYF